MHSCVEVRALVELSFAVVSRVGPGIDVLRGGGRAPSGRGSFRGLFKFPFGGIKSPLTTVVPGVRVEATAPHD